MSQTFVLRACVVFSMLASASSASAQFVMDTFRLRVNIAPAHPEIAAIVLRGDSALFLSQSHDSTAYVFDRKHHRFFRTRAWRKDSEPLRLANARATNLPDSLTLQEVFLNEELPSAVIKDLHGTTIALRGPRVEAEKRWRRQHGLSETPAIEERDDPRAPHPTDWAPISAVSVAVDNSAIWLGLESNTYSYLEFALGGLLRIDRRTHRVAVVEDTAILHRTILQIEPIAGGYLLNAGGKVFRFDTTSRETTAIDQRQDIRQLAVVNDTAFMSSPDEIIVKSLRDGKAVTRGFRLTIEKDSINYVLADKTEPPSWDTLAVLGTAEELGIKQIGAFLKTALHIVKPVALEYFYPGDRITGWESVESADSAQSDEYPREGPNAIMVSGLENHRLRPFLRESLRGESAYGQLDAARILLGQKDTAAIPFLRIALKNWEGPYAADLATILALLGDSTGNKWIHAALLDTLHSAGTGDPTEKIHSFTFDAAGKVRDPRNVPVLLDLSTHPRYGYVATATLLEYNSPEIAERLLARVSRADSMRALSRFLDVMARDTFPMTPSLRDSVRNAAKILLYSSDVRWRPTAVLALARHGQEKDLQELIGALTLDQSSYATAVLQLVKLTGEGVEAMPDGNGNDMSRAAAQRWWAAWFQRNGRTFKARPEKETQAAVIAMLNKLNR